MKFKSIRFKQAVIFYVPCYQRNPKKGSSEYATFSYSLADASLDEQFVASLEPDYILELTGKFDAKTKPFGT